MKRSAMILTCALTVAMMPACGKAQQISAGTYGTTNNQGGADISTDQLHQPKEHCAIYDGKKWVPCNGKVQQAATLNGDTDQLWYNPVPGVCMVFNGNGWETHHGQVVICDGKKWTPFDAEAHQDTLMIPEGQLKPGQCMVYDGKRWTVHKGKDCDELETMLNPPRSCCVTEAGGGCVPGTGEDCSVDELWEDNSKAHKVNINPPAVDGSNATRFSIEQAANGWIVTLNPISENPIACVAYTFGEAMLKAHNLHDFGECEAVTIHNNYFQGPQ